MRKRIAVIVCGLVLAVVGVPAAPAFADSGVTCANVADYGETPEPIIIARTCIAWDDLPAGDKWTLHQSKIWNPPAAPNLYFDVYFYYNTGASGGTEGVANNRTRIRNPGSVGQYTAKFTIIVANPADVWCMYMVPRRHHVEHTNC